MPTAIFDADEHYTTRRIGEGDDRAKKPFGRGDVALELERLAFRAAQGIQETPRLPPAAVAHQPCYSRLFGTGAMGAVGLSAVARITGSWAAAGPAELPLRLAQPRRATSIFATSITA
jgi:hypothetical protein